MFERAFVSMRRVGMVAASAGLFLYLVAASARADEPSRGAALGRIDFESANLPAANIELDLSQGMFENLFEIGDAAIAGIAESLVKSTRSEHADTAKLAADQLAAVRQVLKLSSKVVTEVRIRAYEEKSDDFAPRFEKQIRDGEWEKAVVVRQDRDSARVYVVRDKGAIRGIFVVASNNDGQVLANVVCDVSPENVKELTSAATRIGLDNGLLQQLEAKFKRAHGPKPPGAAKVPAPPQPPKIEK